MFDLTGKTAIVTGATKGLGYATAHSLADSGANVVIVSRSEGDCIKVAEEIKSKGVKSMAYACDITQKKMIDALVENTIKQFGFIDILVNNAGVAITKPAEELTEDDWDFVVDTNLKGVFLTAQAVGKRMIKQKHGRIINIASMLGLVGDKNVLPYLCSKGGVVQLTRGLALEWAKYGIRVNGIAPGYVITPINENVLNEEKVRKYLLDKTPMRRFGTAEEIASAVVYLASDEASYITGTILTVDGGWTAQ
ncbi:MAG: glucose 1-dehydrogenase [Eubacteriales bacterium]|nr:glucose 1-dehydrogenase [Eubacteriales bacterium]